MPAWDDIPEEREAVPAPADGGRRRVRRARRRPGRPARRRDRRGSATATTRWSSTSGATTAPRARARTARSASCWPRTASPPPSTCTSRRSTSSAASTCWASPKVDNQYHAGWAWAGSTPVQGHEAAGLAPRRHPQPDGGPLAGAGSRPTPTPRAQFHHCNDVVPDHLRGRRHHPAARGQRRPRRTRSTASASPTPSTTPRADGRLRTQYFEVMGSRAIYHDGWMASAFGPRLPWVPGLPPGIDDWTPTRTPGSSTTSTRTGPGPRPRRADARQARAAEGDLRHRGRQEQRLPDRRRPVDPDPAPRAADLDRPTASGTSPATSSGCPSSAPRRSGNRANLVTIDARHPRRRQRRALRARRRRRRPHLLRRRRLPLLRVQPLHRHAHQDPRRARSCPPARRRSRSRPSTPSPGPAARSTSP